ncbi:MAG: histidine phosphatase family protein [Pseudomonadota bacterium]
MIAVLALPAFAVSPVMADEALWSALKAGGKVVLMRHAAVERGASPLKYTPGDCSQDMNLSQAGREQAKRVGEMFRARGIFTGEVLASPYCRTMDTARLAFGNVKPSEAMRLIEGIGAQEVERINAQAMKLIGGYKGKANLILVTHQPNVETIALESVEPAGMLVLVPKGGEEFDVLGRLPAPRN